MITYHPTRNTDAPAWTASVTVDGYRIEGGIADTQAGALERLRVACGQYVVDTEHAALMARRCVEALPMLGAA